MSSERPVGELTEAEGGPAAQLFRRAWWAVALRGLLAIMLGIVALTRPHMTMSVLILILAGYLVCDGILTLFAAFHAAARGRTWWPYLLEGLLSFAVGIFGLARPTPLAMMILVLVAVRAIVVGVVEIGTGISVRRASGASGWLLGLCGVASVAFGLLVLGRPSIGVFALAWSLGIYAIAFGLLMDVQAFRAKGEETRRLRTRTT